LMLQRSISNTNYLVIAGLTGQHHFDK